MGASSPSVNGTSRSPSATLVSLAAGKVHKTVKFSGGTAKNAKSAKRIVWSETGEPLSNNSGLCFMPFAFLASLAVQYHLLRRYEVARYLSIVELNRFAVAAGSHGLTVLSEFSFGWLSSQDLTFPFPPSRMPPIQSLVVGD